MSEFWFDEPDTGLRLGDTFELQHFGQIKGLVRWANRNRELDIALRSHRWSIQLGATSVAISFGGFFRQAVRCQKCHYTCHLRCQSLVNLDCRSVSDSLKSRSTEATYINNADTLSEVETEETYLDDLDLAVGEIVEGGTLSAARPGGSEDALPVEIPQGDRLNDLIQVYNKNAAGLRMSMDENNSSFHGFVHIHMNFSRPINIVAGEKPPTMYDVVNDQDTITQGGRKTITSFFLPRNTIRVLHVTSETTTHEMIVTLLKKFKVADNPKKFALYERNLEPGKTLQARLTRISDYECPLRLALLWGSDTHRRFVLQENETGDIMWDAFDIPELNNFLRILDREESLYMHQIRWKYEQYKRHLEMEMRMRNASAPPMPLAHAREDHVTSAEDVALLASPMEEDSDQRSTIKSMSSITTDSWGSNFADGDATIKYTRMDTMKSNQSQSTM